MIFFQSSLSKQMYSAKHDVVWKQHLTANKSRLYNWIKTQYFNPDNQSAFKEMLKVKGTAKTQ